MADVFSTTVACEDCDERKADLQETQHEVIDCVQDPARPGTCTLHYRRPAGDAAAAISATQAQAAKAIVNLFETGEVLGHYGAVTVLAGDPGHLTYGRSQTTLASANLGLLIARYCQREGARFGERLKSWLPALQARDLALDRDLRLHNFLRACADDPVMRDEQDRFFDEAYWAPAERAARKLGLRTALGVAVVYDSWVHGSWAAMRDRTDTQGTVAQSGEKAWITRYIANRHAWLAGHPNPLLRKTVYRMAAFQRLVELGAWGLPLPLVVRDQEISLATLSGVPPGCYDGPQPGTRSVAVSSPLQRGLDVRLLQLGLCLSGFEEIRADGIFGTGSAAWLKSWQQAKGLPPTGVADPATVAKLATV
ncbi:peptidoglycan-binding protein [Ramlibacter sp. XY19]|uniref:peptidoglycan-binding protein n=1 Tax=Ramlibacter paludis TaxID=2908000 RepID=UPI0023DB7220|nr:peptidoglycan-binding protein [Ramlibacter paludis]MCG2592656.1 peptidoglycan-binding protein [Ramlibacter paludis]